MVGILVYGNTHYILSGSRPTAGEAVALARNWSVLQIGDAKSQKFELVQGFAIYRHKKGPRNEHAALNALHNLFVSLIDTICQNPSAQIPAEAGSGY